MGLYDWSVAASANINNNYNATQAKVTIIAYFVNDGWYYQMPINSWVYCGSDKKQTSTVYVDSSTVSTDGGRVFAGQNDFIINKTNSTQSFSCYAEIRDTSGYAGGYTKKSGVYTITVSPITESNFIYVKDNNTWHAMDNVYKKINGVWVKQTDLTNVFSDGVMYKRGYL